VKAPRGANLVISRFGARQHDLIEEVSWKQVKPPMHMGCQARHMLVEHRPPQARLHCWATIRRPMALKEILDGNSGSRSWIRCPSYSERGPEACRRGLRRRMPVIPLSQLRERTTTLDGGYGERDKFLRHLREFRT